jgi:CDP-diacylglycerol--serine O-phosphatidyltransferase
MPIPAGAGVIAAVVHFTSGEPITTWYTTVLWTLCMVLVAYLMVSTWRFYSFKEINFQSRQPFRLIVLLGLLFAGIWYFSGPLLFAIALLYMFSGILWRLQWIFRRRRTPAPPYKEASEIS